MQPVALQQRREHVGREHDARRIDAADVGDEARCARRTGGLEAPHGRVLEDLDTELLRRPARARTRASPGAGAHSCGCSRPPRGRWARRPRPAPPFRRASAVSRRRVRRRRPPSPRATRPGAARRRRRSRRCARTRRDMPSSAIVGLDLVEVREPESVERVELLGKRAEAVLAPVGEARLAEPAVAPRCCPADRLRLEQHDARLGGSRLASTAVHRPV